jgi:hypothetical protein
MGDCVHLRHRYKGDAGTRGALMTFRCGAKHPDVGIDMGPDMRAAIAAGAGA